MAYRGHGRSHGVDVGYGGGGAGLTGGGFAHVGGKRLKSRCDDSTLGDSLLSKPRGKNANLASVQKDFYREPEAVTDRPTHEIHKFLAEKRGNTKGNLSKPSLNFNQAGGFPGRRRGLREVTNLGKETQGSGAQIVEKKINTVTPGPISDDLDPVELSGDCCADEGPDTYADIFPPKMCVSNLPLSFFDNVIFGGYYDNSRKRRDSEDGLVLGPSPEECHFEAPENWLEGAEV